MRTVSTASKVNPDLMNIKNMTTLSQTTLHVLGILGN